VHFATTPDADACSTTLDPSLASSMIDKNAPNGPRCGGKEVGAILAGRFTRTQKPHVCLVHERGGLQRLSVALTSQKRCGNGSQPS
jgi:hypothetical protein